MMRLQLGYTVQVWNPSMKNDMNALKRAAKISMSLRNISYKISFAKLGYKRPNERRVR